MARLPPKRTRLKTKPGGLRAPLPLLEQVDVVAKLEGRSRNGMSVHLIKIGLECYYRDKGEPVPAALSALDLTDF